MTYPYGVGVIGSGDIAPFYLEGMARFPELDVRACAGRTRTPVEEMARRFGLQAHPAVDDLLDDPDVRIVVNLTPPAAHAEITERALRAGKHVFVEKPIATDLEDALRLSRLAERRGLLLGAAADTFLGSAGQTARVAIDSGAIGEPIGAISIVRHSRVETWHPDPRFLFQEGGGPAMDWGPYHLAALVNLLGPIADVVGHARIGVEERAVTSPSRRVDRIRVTVPTHVSGSLRFRSGAVCTVMYSFDVWQTRLPHIEIYGSEGTLSLPDPDMPDGDVLLRRNDDPQWRLLDPVLPPLAALDDVRGQHLRGLGVVDLARVAEGEATAVRAGARLAVHVTEALRAFEASSRMGAAVALSTTCERPEPVRSARPIAGGSGRATA